ncbi:MAG: hypothetical protein GF398_09520 [Chitinivibrionales bacterium]|nr:hypothetical protein [Chitinivibrionales bacterium]
MYLNYRIRCTDMQAKTSHPVPKHAQKYLRLAGGLLIFSAPHAWADSVIRQIGWQRAHTWVIVAVVLVALVLGAFLIIFYLRAKRREQHEQQELSQNRFSEEVERLGLSAPETAKIRRLLHYAPAVQPQVIFQSIPLYEKCLHAHAEKFLGQAKDPVEIRQEEEMLYGLRKKCGYNFIPAEHPLISTRNIAIGQTGSLFGRSNRDALVNGAVVLENKEFVLVIRYDPENSDVFSIQPGNRLKFAFARQNDGVYGIPLTVKAADGSGLIRFDHSLELKRNQLRQYVRMEISATVRIRLLKTADPEKSEIPLREQVECKMVDISGGGLSFLAERALKPGDIISVGFALPGAAFNGIASRIVRVSLQEGKTTTFKRHHVQFVKMDVARREHIVKFIFEKHRQISQWR